jgi:hypothetical protein
MKAYNDLRRAWDQRKAQRRIDFASTVNIALALMIYGPLRLLRCGEAADSLAGEWWMSQNNSHLGKHLGRLGVSISTDARSMA